jgi:dehydrogenase/reductase SDR family member 12
MHPGWCDTPGVRSSMPAFFNYLQSRLRTAAQGADTIVWLAASNKILQLGKQTNGAFFLDREQQEKHWIWCGTQESAEERE